MKENQTSAASWIKKGLKLRQQKKHTEAVEAFEKALQIDTKNDEIWCNLGISLIYNDMFETVVDYLCDYLVILADSQFKPTLYSVSKNDIDRYEKAIEAFNKAIEINANNVTAWIHKIIVFNRLGRYMDAMECVNKAMSNATTSNNAELLYNAGICMMLTSISYQSDISPAIDMLNMAAEIDPQNYDAWLLKSVALYKLGKASEAITSFDKALAIKPNYWRAENCKRKIQ